jgi:hypothetical protein
MLSIAGDPTPAKFQVFAEKVMEVIPVPLKLSRCRSSLFTLLAQATTIKSETQHRGLPWRIAPLGKPA